jgi:serine protease AprX
MMKKASAQIHMANWHRAISALAIVALLVPLLVVAPTVDAPPRAQPILLQMAAERPDVPVRVIVQKQGGPATGPGRAVEDLVVGLGGRVIRNLHIINAFAVELPTGTVPVLARAAGVQWISLDAPVTTSGKGDAKGGGKPSADQLPPTYFLDTLRVRQVWDMGLQGQGITVAVIDSGINNEQDFSRKRVLANENFNPESLASTDGFGHGTHVAGIVGGNGYASDGLYAGIAPQVSLINLKINNNEGMAYESDTVEAMQWASEHRDRYNIRVVNLSVNSVAEGEYHKSPLNAAAEILWFNGIVVVASAGNKGADGEHNTINAAPANDPFIITVGASDECSSSDRNDDAVAPFTARGFTQSAYQKPEIIAPGKDIISVLSNNCDLHVDYPDRVVKDGQRSEYIRLSGTSMSAPMVAGAAAGRARPHA